MLTPRAEEADAAAVVERHAGMNLTFVDTGVEPRKVDFLGRHSEGSVALEVTSCSDGETRKTWDAWHRASEAAVGSPDLNLCWVVMVEAGARHKRLHAELVAPLNHLHAHGIDRFTSRTLAMQPSAVDGPMRRLALMRVTTAAVISCEQHPHGAPHRTVISLLSGGVSSGSNSALDEIELEGRKPDNVEKLSKEDVDARHLFVWLDAATPDSVARPFVRRETVDDLPHFGLPTRDPSIDNVIDVLWVVHRGTRYGWRWARGRGWTNLHAGGGDATTDTSP